MDDIVNLKKLCIKYNIWLHISGDNLSSLALTKNTTEVCLILKILLYKCTSILSMEPPSAFAMQRVVSIIYGY